MFCYILLVFDGFFVTGRFKNDGFFVTGRSKMTGFLLQVASEIPRRCWPRRGSEKVLLKGFCFFIKKLLRCCSFLSKKMDRRNRSNKGVFVTCHLRIASKIAKENRIVPSARRIHAAGPRESTKIIFKFGNPFQNKAFK